LKQTLLAGTPTAEPVQAVKEEDIIMTEK